MLDLEYIEQTAYNIGYDRGLKAGRTQAMREIDEILHRRFSEMGLALRSAEAEMAKTEPLVPPKTLYYGEPQTDCSWK